ncbi:hypothetical protein CEXT_96081 [Caerostris extrusa]|uniref:Uncharacterized protein n=1 Tax=Caerostris extrusa TaxID=172846 RepID=A0AAV4W4E1_CAEEX|nr:hypothetical protein CEXT_96081 [Caerostris extrusa]
MKLPTAFGNLSLSRKRHLFREKRKRRQMGKGRNWENLSRQATASSFNELGFFFAYFVFTKLTEIDISPLAFWVYFPGLI